MNKRVMTVVVAILCASFLVVPIARGHVLITDASGRLGAVLHIQPDDDPIAGETARLYFDLRGDDIDLSRATTDLNIATRGGAGQTVVAHLEDGGVSAEFIFPSQDLYILRLTVDVQGQAYQIEYPLRVTRGVATVVTDRQRHVWAESMLVVTAVGIVAVAIIIYNRRRDIARYSK